MLRHFGKTGGHGTDGCSCTAGDVVVAAGLVLAAVVSGGDLMSVISRVDGTHWVQTVLMLVLVIVEVVWTVLTIVLDSEVMVWVTGHVVKVV